MWTRLGSRTLLANYVPGPRHEDIRSRSAVVRFPLRNVAVKPAVATATVQSEKEGPKEHVDSRLWRSCEAQQG